MEHERVGKVKGVENFNRFSFSSGLFCIFPQKKSTEPRLLEKSQATIKFLAPKKLDRKKNQHYVRKRQA